MLRRHFAILLLAVALATAALAWISHPVVYAQTNDDYGAAQTCQAATGGPCPTPPLATTIGLIINALLGLLGFVFLMIIIWGGISWMTAGGNEEKVTKAKTMISAAIAGLVVVFISYALADAIVAALTKASGTG